MNSLSQDFPSIRRWLGNWLDQLTSLGDDESYRAVVTELRCARSDSTSAADCNRLDNDLELAASVCKNFEQLIKEKRKLPGGLVRANQVVFDKLAEVRAVADLAGSGFTALEYFGTPDLRAKRDAEDWYIEVTRIGFSTGQRSDMYDRTSSVSPDGMIVRTMHSSGKAWERWSEVLYREVEHKFPQVRSRSNGGRTIVWISSGVDYFKAHDYVLPGVNTFPRFSCDPQWALESAWNSLQATLLYDNLNHIAWALGREHLTLLHPPLP